MGKERKKQRGKDMLYFCKSKNVQVLKDVNIKQYILMKIA
jgi:hypothetical protein